MDWFDLLAAQGALKSLLQHHSSKASILWHSDFFTVQLSQPYMTTGKTIAFTRHTFVGKAMSLLFNMLSRFVLAHTSMLKLGFQNPFRWATAIRIVWRVEGAGNRKYNINIQKMK